MFDSELENMIKQATSQTIMYPEIEKFRDITEFVS